MSDWRPYLKDRLISEDPAGFYVIKPEGASVSVPISCPLCRFLMRSRDDELSYFEFECCYFCAMRWAHPRREIWKSGWRPSQDEINAVIADRQPILVRFDVG